MRVLVTMILVLLATPVVSRDLRVEVMSDGLENPWGLTFLPDGRMLLTERAGALWLLDAGGKRLTKIRNVPPSFVKLQGGSAALVRMLAGRRPNYPKEPLTEEER